MKIQIGIENREKGPQTLAAAAEQVLRGGSPASHSSRRKLREENPIPSLKVKTIALIPLTFRASAQEENSRLPSRPVVNRESKIESSKSVQPSSLPWLSWFQSVAFSLDMKNTLKTHLNTLNHPKNTLNPTHLKPLSLLAKTH